jgi:hypothetical protein
VSGRVGIGQAKHGSTILPRSTVEQLRSDIDHGRTCDKIDAPDPSIAPLGSDEEAAGTPPDPAAVEVARALELSRPCPSSSSSRRGSSRGGPSRTGLGAAWLLIAFAVALGAGLTSWMLWLGR